MRVLLRFRPTLILALAGVLALLVPAAAGAAPRTKVIRYHGYRLIVPAAWPVYDLATHPTVCVRFDRHAVYLGRPGAQQRCPAHAAGRTEAILLAPLAAHRAGAPGARGLA